MLQRLVVKKRLTKHLQVYRDASPITRVRPDAPPFYILHGVDDSLIPVPEARQFVAAMRDVSKDTVVYSEIPHAQHAFDFFGSPRGYYTARAVEKFLSWVHAKREEK
jgi:acetyl esterase/lipase